MATAQPQTLPFSQVIPQIEAGTIKIPQFQREFVWAREKSARLLDSIVKGYPIGTFILWNTPERLRVVRNVGSVSLPDTPDGQFANLVLDGQQRLTSLYAAVKGLTIHRDGNDDDFGAICLDLRANPDSDDPVVLAAPLDGEDDKRFIRLTDLMAAKISLYGSYPEALHDRLQQYRDRISNYSFSVVSVQNAPIEVATEIFTRLNVEGQRLSTFEIMVAKTFDQSKNFDLSEKYAELIQRLSEVEYGTLPSAVVLQTVGAIQDRAIKAKEILALPRVGFVETWPKAVDGIERAVDYLRNYFRIPVSKLLPYPHLVVPFAYFFHHHPDTPLDKKKDLLEDFFWRVTLTSWYSRSVEGRIEADLAKIDAILKGEQPTYEVGVDASPKAIAEYGWFRAGRAWVKGILCLLAFQQPKSFANGALVRISNDWLKQANSKNYHHFFPRAWAKNNGLGDDGRINHVANITIVDDFLNKRSIKARAPSDYIGSYKKVNPELADALTSHLIDLDADGVLKDDFDTFFQNRCKRISEALKQRLISLPLDEHGTAPEMADEEGED